MSRRSQRASVALHTGGSGQIRQVKAYRWILILGCEPDLHVLYAYVCKPDPFCTVGSAKQAYQKELALNESNSSSKFSPPLPPSGCVAPIYIFQRFTSQISIHCDHFFYIYIRYSPCWDYCCICPCNGQTLPDVERASPPLPLHGLTGSKFAWAHATFGSEGKS